MKAAILKKLEKMNKTKENFDNFNNGSREFVKDEDGNYDVKPVYFFEEANE